MAEINGRSLPSPPLDLFGGASLFLDFDGTIVAIEAAPDHVRVTDALRSVLERAASALDGRLALVSGRGALEVRDLFGASFFVIAGSHGLEILRPDGTLTAAARPASLSGLAARLQSLQRIHPAVLVEEKPLSVALHYRQAPDAEAACLILARDLAMESGLVLQPGKMVFELRAPGANKGSAVATLMGEPAMAGTRPIFIGDDVTDEAGFAAAARLGGAGILVGPARDTAAAYRLDDVEDTLRWLERAAGATA